MVKKRLSARIAMALSAAIVSVASPVWQLSTYAEGAILVKMPGASATAGTMGTWDLTWTVGNNDVTLGTNTGENVVDDAGAKAISFQSISDVKGGLWFESQGNFCDSYNGKLSVPGGWQRNLTCVYSPQTEYGGNISQLYFTDDVEMPNEASFFIFSVEAKGEDQSSFFSAIFDNVEQYDEQEGAYVVVGPAPSDTSLSGKHFTISANAFIGGKGDEHGTIYSIDTQNPDAYRNLSLTISGDDFDKDTMALVLHGDNNYQQVTECTRVGSGCVVSFSDYNLPDSVNIDIMSKGGDEPTPPEPGPQPHPGDPTQGTVRIHSSDNGKSFYQSRVSINGVGAFNEDCEWDSSSDTQCPAVYEGNINYNKEAEVNTVEVSFSPLFDKKIINKIIINNVQYDVPINYSNRQSWLSHYDHQELKFTLDNVAYASSYDITVDVAAANPDEIYIGNFLWSNDEKDKDDDVYIGHARIEMISLLCHIDEGNDVLITPETENIPEGCVVEFDQNDENKGGSLVVPDGSVATLKLWTEYGWQVVSFGANGQAISVDPDKVAEYTFTIAKGNFHLGAVVEQTSDEVKADSEKIKSGSIELGGSEIDEGTAMLTVGDADLSDEEKDEFQKQVGGYNVSSYLEIDLDQIFYDGHGSYWKGAEMKELDNEATITLQLEEGVDGNEVVIVHKKHDGTYEVIPTVYNPVTHTITFKTSSFSDYAIASRTVTPPKTFDEGIMGSIVLLILCTTVGAAIFASRRIAMKKSD